MAAARPRIARGIQTPIAALAAVEAEAEGVNVEVGRGATVAGAVGAGVVLGVETEEDEEGVVERGDGVDDAVGDAVEGAEAGLLH